MRFDSGHGFQRMTNAARKNIEVDEVSWTRLFTKRIGRTHWRNKPSLDATDDALRVFYPFF